MKQDTHEDLQKGLTSTPKRIPSKYFYDARGSELFDRICETDEYYPTRTEQRLLETAAADIAATSGSRELVELGSGSARKTGALLNAMNAGGGTIRYIPMDISEAALECASNRIGARFPDIDVTPVTCDYTRGMNGVRIGDNGLAAFLGSTIGNFSDPERDRLLSSLRSVFPGGGWFLLGIDLVKPHGALNAAYNDSQGITAAFNRNILDVVNRVANADFDAGSFEHSAFFDPARSRVEMHLVATRDMSVRLGAFDRTISIETNEGILTEISRKFTKESTEGMLVKNGFEPVRWYTDERGWMGLSLARAEVG